MAPNRWITALCTSLLLLIGYFSSAQCTYTHFTLSPISAVCGSSVDVSMSGSDNSNYIYQLSIGGTNVGPTHHGTTGPIDFGVVTTGGTAIITATIFGSNCSAQVVASTYINFVSSAPTGGSISSAGTIICPGSPVTLTLNPPDGQTYTYQWKLNGANIGGATSSTYAASSAGVYSMALSNACGAETISGPTLTAGVIPGAPGPVSGNTNLQTENNSAAFSVTAGANATSYNWSVSDINAGTMANNGTSATFIWNSNYSGTVTINAAAVTSCGTTAATGLSVTVHPRVVSGSVTPTAQTINYNATPSALSVSAATGGNGTYTYQWQSSPDNSTWTNVSGATATAYSPPALTATTYYRVVSTSNGINVTSNTATVTVYPQLVAGGITSGNQSVNYNTVPTAITSAAATGGSGTYSYQWQNSPDNSAYTNITGATATSYSPGTLTATTYYHLTSTSNGVNVNGATATVTVYPQLASGSISPASQSINYNTAPSTLTCSAATGGNGSYSYQWQSSSDAVTWTSIVGQYTTSYTPGALTTTMYYRLVSTSNGVSVNSNTATVNVYALMQSGLVTPGTQSINYNTVPAALSVSAATGGSGAYTYQWQSSPDNSTWINISGATTTAYAPAALTAAMYYRVVTSSNGVNVTSNTATITVYPQLLSGSIAPASQNANYNSVPAQMTYSGATGGNGTYTYQWQNSPNNSTWTNISGATGLNYLPGALTTTTYYHMVTTSNGVSVNSATATVSIYPQLVSGTISPASQSINYNTAPSTLTCSVPTGGSGSYSYQWQSSSDAVTWTNITGQYTTSYTPGALTTTMYYRLVSTSNGASVNSNAATVNVYALMQSGVVTPGTQSINYNTVPAGLSVSAATGGAGAYTYQWQSSPNNSTWTNISGATTTAYTPAALTATMYYRVVTTSNGVNVTSNTATITVYPQLVAGTITPATQGINYNTVPSTITSTAATGGNGTYTYQWQNSPNNSTWANITGATATSYSPGTLTATTYYHLISTSNGVSVTGATATVSIYPALVSGTVTPASQSINYNAAPSTLTSSAPTGGSGSYTYQWQNSPNNSTWTNITGATGISYLPGTLTATTYYHLITSSNGLNVTSAAATVTIYPQLIAGAITSGNQNVNYNAVPSAIASAAATGGNGTYTYQWQNSPDNGTWTNITGATATSYSPGALTATTYYHLISTSNGVNVTGAAATVTVLSASCVQFITPTLTQNYVVTNTPRAPGFATENQFAGQGSCAIQQAIQYVDGLGRPIQSIQVMASPLGHDMVAPQTYNQYGREVNKYLPYTPATGTQGSYRPNAISTDQSAFYNAPPTGVVQIPTAGQVAYAATRYEASPLERPLEQGAPGLSWQLGGGHTVTTAYYVNASTDAVKEWVVNATGGASYATTYPAGTLIKTTVIDENQNNNAVIQFKDIDGRVICRKVQSGTTTYLVTDYVYDDQGNLRYVIPPLPTVSGSNPAVAMPTTFGETTTVFLNYFYGYHYDGLKRQVAKKIPGKGWQYMVYNTMDQPILTRDTNQSAKGIWMVLKYDALGRVVMTGEFASTATQSALQSNADTIKTNLFEAFTNATTNYGYTHLSNPDISTGTGNKVLTVNYYDNYSVISNTVVNPGSSVFSAPSAAIDSLDKLPRSLPVATLVNVLGTSSYLFSVTQYDKYGRAVKVINQNFVNESPAYNKYDTQDNQYSFQSLPTQSIRNHYLPASTNPQLTINSWSVYDNMNRPLLTKQQYISQTNTGAVVTLNKMDYDELGQLLTKHLHSTSAAANPANSTFLQHIDYRYNPRGWVTKINDPTSLFDQTFTSVPDVFSEQLDYDQLANGYTGTAQYNGNISTLRWQTYLPAGISLAQEQKGYIFTYDNLNRLTASVSKAATTGDTQYNETMTYDELGNIITLVRKNGISTTLNNLTYNYVAFSARSNKLSNTTDAGTEGITTSLHYDANGSLTSDTHKTVTAITYNEINLPQSVTLTNNSETLTYNYDATGKKLERIIKWGTTIEEDRSYDDGIEYSGSTSPTIELVHTPEGRALPSAGAYTFQYAVTDHLGNTRALFSDLNNDGVLTANEILQTTDYYAFGREILYSQNVTPGPDNKYKYNGKEYQADLSEYDYGARHYDPVIGRWTSIDPLAEISRRWSPYNYVENDPIRNTDPDGMSCDCPHFHFPHDPDDPDHGNLDDFNNDNHTPDNYYHPKFMPSYDKNNHWGDEKSFTKLSNSVSTNPPDKFTITTDGDVKLKEANNDKHFDFYDEQNRYLFSIYEDPESTNQSIQGTKHDPYGAQGLQDFTSYVAAHADFSIWLLGRGVINDWNSTTSVMAAVDAGRTENLYKKFWDVISFTPWGAFYDENAMKGRPRDPTGLINKKIDFVLKVKELITPGH